MGQKYAAYNSSGAVIAFYDSKDSPPPATANVIDITDSGWQAALASTYPVSVENGAMVIPSGPTLAQAQSAQIALVTKGYNTATDYVPVTINGTAYQVDNTAGKQALNLSLAITANAMLQSPAWAASTEYGAGTYCNVGGVILFCSASGKSGTSAPTPPTTFGTTVTDGTAAWELLGRKIYLQGGSFVYMTPQQIMSAFQQGELYLHQMSDQLESLKAEINAATTVTAVQTFELLR